jgi:hypothetical protein
VHWSGFRLYDQEWKWCADRFLGADDRLYPESYITDGTVVTFSTRNASLFAKDLTASFFER